MVTAKEVPADELIRELVKELKKMPQVKPPEWAMFAKTGSHKEKVPEDPDWWYVRAASILRKLYISGEPIGIGTFRTIYGGRKERGSRPPHFRKAGGSHIRKILQQLEAAGLVQTVKSRGRTLSPAGRSFVDKVVKRVFDRLVERMPEMAKYAG